MGTEPSGEHSIFNSFFFAFQIGDFFVNIGIFHLLFLTAIGTVSGPRRTLEQKSAGLTGKYQAVFPPSRLGPVQLGSADTVTRPRSQAVVCSVTF
ncbi:MAG: hypothetical protein LBC21_03595, partial [Oscillospiraceae bacterium]|nr:hypothetical protein [Oscillospiraceae bacterium]